jgi:hypothetical protein
MPVINLITEMEKFMVPVGPTGKEDPPSGWPDKGHQPPGAITGVSLADSANAFTLVGAGFTIPLTGGTVSIAADASIPGASATPPAMLASGVTIVGNTPTEIYLASAVEDGGGEQTALVTASSSDQRLFQTGVTNISLVTSVRRISPAADGAMDAAASGHNLTTGAVGVGAFDPAITAGEQIEIKYRRSASNVPAGRGYIVNPPRPTPEPTAFTVGTAWSTAYAAYFGAGVPAPIPGSYDAATQAMKVTMDGFAAVPNMGAVGFTAGLLAFWGVVAASAATIWPAVTATAAVPPPGVFAAGPLIMATMLPTVAIPAPAPGDGWTSVRSQADVALMASAIALASAGALIITQPGPVPVPVPFVLA